MSKQKILTAHSISISNCECCGGVHVELWRNGKMFAVAMPTNADTADRLALDVQAAATIMRQSEGKSHAH